MHVPQHHVTQPPNLITAVILFVDLQGSVNLSNSLSIWEYDKLINDYQSIMSGIVNELQERYEMPEWSITGDELKVFFYRPADVQIQAKLAAMREKGGWHSDEYDELSSKMRAEHDRLIYGALRTAIYAKHKWICYSSNVERIRAKQNPTELGCGINMGRVILSKRFDGKDHIEGYAINYAKRVEGTSRYGRLSQIAVSRSAYDYLRNIKIGHSMLKQRLFFKDIVLPPDAMKGLPANERIHEISFFHRLSGVKVDSEQYELFMRILLTDPSNFWAYSNIISYLLYDQNDVAASKKIVEYVMNSIPSSEKLYYDMGIIHYKKGDYETAQEYCFMALRLNEEFDIAYNLLADIEEEYKADPQKILEYASKAASLVPGSALNQFALAKAHYRCGDVAHARHHAEEMLDVYPAYAKTSENVASFLKEVGMTPDAIVSNGDA